MGNVILDDREYRRPDRCGNKGREGQLSPSISVINPEQDRQARTFSLLKTAEIVQEEFGRKGVHPLGEVIETRLSLVVSANLTLRSYDRRHSEYLQTCL